MTGSPEATESTLVLDLLTFSGSLDFNGAFDLKAGTSGLDRALQFYLLWYAGDGVLLE